MISKSRTVTLISKLNPDVFKIINKDVFGTTEQPLGSVQGAVTRILAPEYEQMLRTIMPGILSISPNDPTWFKRVKNYWDSFGIRIPIGGKNLEIGFNFDINDTMRSTAIKQLIVTAKTKESVIDSDESFANYVLKNITEFEKYKYAMPINQEQYLIWVFCLGHRKVAKQAESLDKSTNIEFILIDPKDIEDTRKAQHIASNEATKKYLEIINDRNKVKDVLYAKGINVSILDEWDADAKLKHLADSNPKEFLAIANDPTTTAKARIERYCISGVLKRLPNSSIIVDSNDNSVVIGNTIAEAVAFFSSEAPDRVAKVKEFQTRYKQIVKS